MSPNLGEAQGRTFLREGTEPAGAGVGGGQDSCRDVTQGPGGTPGDRCGRWGPACTMRCTSLLGLP